MQQPNPPAPPAPAPPAPPTQSGFARSVSWLTSNAIPIIATGFLFVFTAVWIALGVQILTYDPTPAQPLLPMSQAQVVIAGFLATTVSVGTASVLGFTVADVTNEPGQGAAAAVAASLVKRPGLVLGCLLYFLVGVWVLVVYYTNSDKAPEAFGAFALSAMGWAAGAFSALYKKDDGSG